MSSFKLKTKKNMVIDQRVTLDAKHNEMVKYFKNLKKSVVHKKKKIKEIENNIVSLNKQISTCDGSELPSLTNSKIIFEEQINELKKDIEKIESNEEEDSYYLQNGDLIFQYFANIDKIEGKNESDDLSILNFFSNEGDKNEIDDNSSDDDNFIIDDDGKDKNIKQKTNKNINDYINRTENFKRAEIFEKFMTKVDPHFNITQKREYEIINCTNCESDIRINQVEGIAYCNECGYGEFIKIDCEKRSYKDPPPEMSYFAYKRINHFREWLAQFQAKETTDIPQNVYDTLLIEIKKNRISDMRRLTPTKVRDFLKKHKLNKYYEHIPHIIYKLNGIRPPVITKDMEDRLCNAFKDIQGPFQKVCPKGRKNFLSYSYVLYKFSQLLELDELSPCFNLLKSKEKLHNQDIIWKEICKELKWQYIDTVY